MDNKLTPAEQSAESKSKRVWKSVGMVALAIGLAIFTVIVINL